MRMWLAQWLCATVVAAGLSPAAAGAATRCAPAGSPGMERCVTGLPAPVLARMQQPQEASQWCWAASISMVLRRHGIDVPQAQVVRAHFGGLRDEAIAADDLAVLLTREWRDAEGRSLQVLAQPVPRWRGASFGIAAPEVLAELEAARPLIVSLRTHAVVLVQLVYERPAGADGGAVRLVRATVLDPAAQVGLRSLTARDGDVLSLTRVRVDGGVQVAAADR